MQKTSILEMVVVPCLTDNYAYIIHNKDTGETALVDAPAAAPIQAALDTRGWTLTDILITHHHDDHIAGVDALRANARVIGASADAHRLPNLDLAVCDGDCVSICGQPAHVIDVSGHTVGHIAFHMPQAGFAFTADSLMAMGCGRLFEGTPEQMWCSLQKLRALPDDTIICSGHEYTQANAHFAMSLDPENQDLISRVKVINAAREMGQSTVPSTLNDEKRTNPFLRVDIPAFKSALGMEKVTDQDVFTFIRAQKDRF